MNVKFCLVFPREALSVPVMRHVLGDTLRDLGADDDGVADLLLAVTEACSNVVKHGGPGQRYEVLASVGQGGCEVQVVNSGRGSDTGRWPGLRPRPGRPRRAGYAAGCHGRRRCAVLDRHAPAQAFRDGLSGRGDRGHAGVRARLGDHEGLRG